MKKRKQKAARFLCLLMVSAVLSCMAGCEGKGGSEPAQPALETVTYSNLTDADSRALLSGLLEKSGVAEARIQALLACVDQFNAAVKPAWLTDGCRTDFADIQNKKECGGNRQWQNHYLRNWAANTKGKGII